MITIKKGDIGVAKIVADLLSAEFEVLTPYSPGSPFDLAVHTGGRFFKVQCKYREVKDGVLIVSHRRMTVNYKQQKSRRLNRSEVDVLAIYCPNTGECYYVPYSACNGNGDRIYLRIEEPRNKQEKGIRYARDFLDPKKAFSSVGRAPC